MEKEFFKWEDWEEIDISVLCFYNCTLLKEIGIFQPGTCIDSITIDYNKGYISIYDMNSDTTYTYGLSLSIGDELKRY